MLRRRTIGQLAYDVGEMVGVSLECLFCWQGRGKKQESLIGGVRSVWRLVTGDYGTIQVNMAQPFSLQVWKIVCCCGMKLW